MNGTDETTGTRTGGRFTKVLMVALAALLLAGIGLVVRHVYFAPKTITAYFTSATAIYPGDEVRVSGVKVGTITSIEPLGTQAKMTLAVDHGVPVPADAKAVIVAQNLVSARYVQLAPAYTDGGPVMANGAVIPIERTAVPVEWDQLKEQLTRLATDLGPSGGMSGTATGRFIETAANAMDGNGEKLRQTIAQLSGVSRILADGSGNIADMIKNLDTFVGALRDSNVEIVQFENRLASLSSVVDGSRSDLDAALTNLSEVVGEVQRFVKGTRDQTAEQLRGLVDLTQNLVDHRTALENVLHVSPNAFANGYNVYNPDTGDPVGAFAMANFSNPVQLVCSSIAAAANVTASESGKLCAQYLGPAARLINFNYLPFPFNAYLMKSPSPQNLVYSDPRLAPGGGGIPDDQPQMPPSVSAYTGIGDVPPPPGWDNPMPPPGAYTPDGLPAAPQPALFPGAPIPPGVPSAPASSPKSLQDMLLPAEAPPATPASTEGAPPA